MPSLLEALETKYFSDHSSGDSGDDDCSLDDKLISIYIPRLPPLMCVPELLVLNDCDIDCAGDFQSIEDKCQRVRELDLAQNKLHDWNDVFDILKHMPRIEFVNLSKNTLMGARVASPPPSINHPISNLRGLVLNGTYLDWACIDMLLDNLPILEELHLSLNNYDEVLIDTTESACPLDSDCHCCAALRGDDDKSNSNCPISSSKRKRKKISSHNALKTLHFTGNPIESWPEVCRLGRVFPNMENLVLADCPIKSLTKGEEGHYPITAEQANATSTPSTNPSTSSNNTPQPHQNNTNDNHPSASSRSSSIDEDLYDDQPHKHFRNLLFLNLSCANINTWDDIDQLSIFPKLMKLRAKNWPLWENIECTEHERRQLLIARLPNVTQLNGGGTITADEREDAERYFIRHYMEKPESQRPARYTALVAKHGQLDPLVNINLKPDKRVKIFLTYGDSRESRLVDVYRTVADLKQRLEKILNLPANKMRLYYLDQDYKEMGPEEMKYPNKMLYSYNIHSGDEIIVDEKK